MYGVVCKCQSDELRDLPRVMELGMPPNTHTHVHTYRFRHSVSQLKPIFFFSSLMLCIPKPSHLILLPISYFSLSPHPGHTQQKGKQPRFHIVHRCIHYPRFNRSSPSSPHACFLHQATPQQQERHKNPTPHARTHARTHISTSSAKSKSRLTCILTIR